MTRILVATHNSKKRSELRKLLKDFKGIKVLDLDDLSVSPPNVVEDGKTFRQNAVKKAVTVSKFFDGIVLADDSGLEVDALDGKPGVRSARFARAKATDEENVTKLLRLLEGSGVPLLGCLFQARLAGGHNGDLCHGKEPIEEDE